MIRRQYAYVIAINGRELVGRTSVGSFCSQHIKEGRHKFALERFALVAMVSAKEEAGGLNRSASGAISLGTSKPFKVNHIEN